MTVAVTMLQTRWGEDGTLWQVSTTHDASDEFATYLVTNQFATGTLPTSQQSYPVATVLMSSAEIAAIDGSAEVGWIYEDRDTGAVYRGDKTGALFPVGSGVADYLGSGNQAAMLAVTGEGVVVGAWFLRTDLIPAHNWYLDALPASTLGNWRSGLPVDPNAPVFTLAVLGGSSFEGYDQLNTIASISRSSNVVSVTSSGSPLGGNYIGQRVRLSGLLPADLCGVFTKLSASGAGTFTFASNGPDLTGLGTDITANTLARWRNMSVQPKQSPVHWAVWMSGLRIRLLFNASVPSDTWELAGQRIQRDIAAHSPAGVLVNIGANGLGLAGDPLEDAQALMVIATKRLDALRALGVQVLLCSINPVGTGNASHVAFNARLPYINALYADYAATYPEQVHYIDTYSSIVSDIGSGEMGAAAAIMQSDGTHYRQSAAIKMGQVIANAIAALGFYGRRYNPPAADGYPPLKLGFDSNTAGGTAGAGASGDIPAGWTVARSSGTLATGTCSIVERADGTYALRVLTSAGGGSTLQAIRLSLTSTSQLAPYMPPGSKWAIAADVSHTNIAGEAEGNGHAIGFTFVITVNSVAYTVYTSLDANTPPTTGSQMQDYAIRYLGEFTVPNPGAGGTTVVDLQIGWGIAGATAEDGVLEIGDIVLTRVG